MPLKYLRTLFLRAACLVCLLAGSAGAQQAPATAGVPLLHFADFFKLPLGARGLEMTPALLQAHGQTVRLDGYMVQQEQPALGHFMLTPRPVRMSEHADGDADDLPAAWAMVYLDASQQDFAIPYQRGLLELTGVLSVGRLEEQDGRVSWVRLQLGSAATRGMNALEVANYLHSLQHQH
ncbi:MAG: hypothetical protein HXX19_08905 [Rhodoferax sp.]|nr:hypothetical protein [Rhodoferax sp.]